MRFEKSDGPGSRWADHRVFAIVQRVRSRNNSFVRDGQRRFSRQRRTWTASVQASCTKMHYRHGNPPELPSTLTPWDSLIVFQKRKWNTRLDELTRWQRTEYWALEKMNEARFERVLRYRVGSLWAYATDMQVTKANRMQRRPRRQPGRRTYWSQVLWRGHARSRREPALSGWQMCPRALQKAQKDRSRAVTGPYREAVAKRAGSPQPAPSEGTPAPILGPQRQV